MSNDLITPAELTGFPGTLTDEVVDAAVAELRALAGWHVAPSRTETVVLDADGTSHLLLPSMYVTDVSAVRDVYTPTSPTAITGFRWSRMGVIQCTGRTVTGFQAIEADITHGYDECPADLKPALVAIIQAMTTDATVAQQAAGPFSVTQVNLSTLATWLDRGTLSAISRYKIPSRP